MIEEQKEVGELIKLILSSSLFVQRGIFFFTISAYFSLFPLKLEYCGSTHWLLCIHGLHSSHTTWTMNCNQLKFFIMSFQFTFQSSKSTDLSGKNITTYFFFLVSSVQNWVLNVRGNQNLYFLIQQHLDSVCKKFEADRQKFTSATHQFPYGVFLDVSKCLLTSPKSPNTKVTVYPAFKLFSCLLYYSKPI